jgi:fumarylacetoacetate (FAA) hydrolase
MKLGTLKSAKSLDGELIVVNRKLTMAVKAAGVAANFREAMENWQEVKPKLEALSQQLNAGQCPEAFPFKESEVGACIPRTYLFADGSAYIQHVRLVRMARKAPMPETLETVPLIYQGECARFLSPTEDIPQIDFNHGTDFEGEVAVVTGFVPMGATPEQALESIRFVLIMNDVSLRGLIPAELAQGFGFFQSKPASALSPVCVTPDELGEAWVGGRVHLPLKVQYNDQFFGEANAKEMHFHFGQIISHVARTRDLQPGTIIGSGTVSNEDTSKGSSCLAEKRMLEQINDGEIKTPFMKVGDTVSMEMCNAQGQSIFGRIHQKVIQK